MFRWKTTYREGPLGNCDDCIALGKWKTTISDVESTALDEIHKYMESVSYLRSYSTRYIIESSTSESHIINNKTPRIILSYV